MKSLGVSAEVETALREALAAGWKFEFDRDKPPTSKADVKKMVNMAKTKAKR